MHKNKTNRLILYVILAILSIAAIILAVVRCALLIEENYEKQLAQNLSDVSYQNAENLITQINDIYDLLGSINKRLEMEGENREYYMPEFARVVDNYDLRRIGYVDKNGIAFTTDGLEADLSFRDFYIKGMQGKSYISDILTDRISNDKNSIIVISMPMREPDGEVEGVSFLTYENTKLSNRLKNNCFNGDGDLFVINQNGHVVASSDDDIMPISTGIFTDTFNDSIGKDEEIDRIYNAFVSKDDIGGLVSINNKDYYYHMTPVNLIDGEITWYTFSIVPHSYFQARFYDVKRNLYRMVIIVLLICLFCAVVGRIIYRNQRKMTYALAYESQLTGGPNKARLLYELSGMKEKRGFIAYMNLEDFTHTRIAAGPKASEELILTCWNTICEFLLDGEKACHDREDAFVLYLKESDENEVIRRMTELRNVIHEKGQEMNLHWVYPKFGVSLVDNETEPDGAVSKAQYTVFDTWGMKECVSFYKDETHEKVALDKSIEELFDVAIEKEQFEVWFQPKFSVSGDVLTGAEALVRWRKEDGSIIPPGLFIPILERNGDISRLDRYVVEHVCKRVREWKEKGYKVVPVSVNFSRATLYYQNLVEDYDTLMEKYGINSSEIQLEVTESILGSSEKVIELLTNFRNKGVRILMDDFGTGYSSLSVLNSKCFDVLKIDKSLADGLEDEFGKTIVFQTIDMANALGLHVTIEGVEKKEQLEILNGQNCDIQGFVFSKPLECKDFETVLKEHQI